MGGEIHWGYRHGRGKQRWSAACCSLSLILVPCAVCEYVQLNVCSFFVSVRLSYSLTSWILKSRCSILSVWYWRAVIHTSTETSKCLHSRNNWRRWEFYRGNIIYFICIQQYVMPFVLHRFKSIRPSAYRFHTCSPPEAGRWKERGGDFCGHCSIRWEAWGCDCSHEQYLPSHQIQCDFPYCYFEWYCGSLEVMIFSLDSHNTVKLKYLWEKGELTYPGTALLWIVCSSYLLLLIAAFWQGCSGESYSHSFW